MKRGKFPFNRASQLDIAIVACIVAMVAFSLFGMRHLIDQLESKPTMTTTEHSIMVSTDARPVAFCTWVES